MKWFSVLGLIFVFVIGYVSLPRYLQTEKDIHAKVLVVEGWISDEAILEVTQMIEYNSYSVVYTTGGPMPADYKMLLSGDLVFNVPVLYSNPKSITVNACGTDYNGENAHFILLVNSIPVGDTIVTTDLKAYKFKLPNTIPSISSLTIRFDNDAYESEQNDRNFLIRSVIIGERKLMARNDSNVYISKDGIVPAHTSYANKVAFELKQKFGDNVKIVAVPSDEPDNKRTKASAEVLHKYLEKNNEDTANLELFSQGIHTRRSWLTYRNIFGEGTDIGCLAAYDSDFSKGWWKSWSKNKKVWRELAGVVYYQFVLLLKSF